MRAKTRKPPPLSVAVQVAGLQRLFPSGDISWNRHRVSWKGDLCPGEYSRTYSVEVAYERGDSPRVWVRNPDLKTLAGDRPLPHVYEQKAQELCLYLPGCGFWGPQKSVASTVMPWACLWLRYFELWLVTDIWFGRGEHVSLSE